MELIKKGLSTLYPSVEEEKKKQFKKREDLAATALRTEGLSTAPLFKKKYKK